MRDEGSRLLYISKKIYIYISQKKEEKESRLGNRASYHPIDKEELIS
jgi:hypothetical protein